MKLSANIKIDTSEDAMWGADGCDGYDEDASVSKYVSMVRAEIAESYGDELAEIVIEETEGRSFVKVDDDDHTTMRDTILRCEAISMGIEDILTRIWSGFEWAVATSDTETD